MRELLLVLTTLFLMSANCEKSIAVLVAYACDSEDLILESSDGSTLVEFTRMVPGVAPKCLWIAESRIPTLHSRCESDPISIPAQYGVFSPAIDCP